MSLSPEQITDLIDHVIYREGGFVDHPDDLGGCTKFGITRATLEDWFGTQTTCTEVAELTHREATEFYREKWVRHRRLRLDLLHDPRLAEHCLDGAIMFSLGRRLVASWLQEACNRLNDGGIVPPRHPSLAVDGWIGPKTREAAQSHPSRDLINWMVALRVMKHARVVTARPESSVFLAGWINRAVGWIR